MDTRRIGLVWLMALAVALGAGCKKSQSDQSAAPDSPAPAPAATEAETVARIHWLGKKRLAAETNAAHLMGIWNLPESGRLKEQTLHKLSSAPWRFWKGGAETNAAPTALLRALLDDLVEEESYLEARGGTNQPVEIVFAIRLSAERAALWHTNLAAVTESLTGERSTPTKGGWSLKKHDAPDLVELARAGDWMVVGLAQKSNTLLSVLKSRIQHNGTPLLTLHSQPATNYWLTVDLDFARAATAPALNWPFPENLPKMSLTMIGDGSTVQTRGELSFPKPLELDLEPWNIPTNLIHDPLVSFTAIRGIRPWLTSIKAWQNLKLGEPPNQVYLWGLGATPFQSYFAAPSAGASNQVFQLTERTLEKGNVWLQNHAIGEFVRLETGNGFRWTGVPFITPVLQSVAAGDAHFIKGSFFPTVNTNKSMPVELVYAVLTRTNLVGYDWEITAPRFDGWTGVGQALRISLGRARMPAASAGITWLRAIKPRLGNCTTGVLLTSPSQLGIVRSSSMGLTAMELHLLADWLESPQFPRGLHTLLAPADLPLRKAQPDAASPSPP